MAFPGSKAMKRVLLASALLLTACSQDAARRFGETIFADNSPPTFVANAVRPIWKCGEAPNPLYPCYGMGPEGFVRDLVARPLFNPQRLHIRNFDTDQGFAVRWTWFSMQGGCRYRISRNSYLSKGTMMSVPVVPHRGEQPHLVGLTRPTAVLLSQSVPERQRPVKPAWPPQPICDAQAFDVMTPSRPFSAAMWIWMPEPEERSSLFSRPVTPSPSGRFDTGCRWEKRSGLDWQICRTAIMQPEKGASGKREDLMERWQASLGNTGFHIQITGHFYDPLFLWPQWYAERHAALLEVIDSVRLEPAAPPTPEEKAAFPGWLAKIEAERQANLRRVEELDATLRAREQERTQDKGEIIWW
jgi:hypothetical protein